MTEEQQIDPNFLRVQQIQATNNNTVATRGLLKVVLYEGTGLLVGGVIWGYSLVGDWSGGIFLGAFVVIGGSVAAVIAGYSALSNSTISTGTIPGVKVPKGWY